MGIVAASSPSDNLDNSGGPEYRTMQMVVTDHLRSDILSGRISPGARLHHDDIARRLGVSRTPVREALRVLDSEGLVDLRPHRGAVVVELRTEDIEEIFEIRALLEPRAVELGVSRLNDADIARLHQIYREMAWTQDPERWLRLNRGFHSVIYLACRWPRLSGLIDAQRNAVERYLRMALVLGGRTATAHEEHRQILESAQEGDGRRTSRLMAQHLRSTKQGLIDCLTSRRQGAES